MPPNRLILHVGPPSTHHTHILDTLGRGYFLTPGPQIFTLGAVSTHFPARATGLLLGLGALLHLLSSKCRTLLQK